MTYKAALWAIAGCLSTVVLAQGPTSGPAAQSGATTTGQASQPGGSKKTDRAANRAFAKKVHQALNKTKGLAGTDIAVFANAQTGEVILSGFIDTPDQEQIATDAASKVQGVTSVSSKIVQRPQL
ncbi:BON domain-containing protein [Paraburkholderia panacisoli]|nr:BON domain-containing protein [Paraburkholderia panacisoli]